MKIEFVYFYGLYKLNVDFHSRHSLSAGGPGSLLGALRLRGLPWTRIPAGVSYLTLQSTLFYLLDRAPFDYKFDIIIDFSYSIFECL
jgi:hypothetical protein